MFCLVPTPTGARCCGVQLQHVLANCRSRVASPASACSRMCAAYVARYLLYMYVCGHAICIYYVFECALLLYNTTPRRVQYKLTLSDCKLCRVTALNSKQQPLQFKCSYLKCGLLLLCWYAPSVAYSCSYN